MKIISKEYIFIRENTNSELRDSNPRPSDSNSYSTVSEIHDHQHGVGRIRGQRGAGLYPHQVGHGRYGGGEGDIAGMEGEDMAY